jgi:hypothetical protein
MSRLAVPLPTVMPSYNQIGFDSLHYLVGVVESGVGWMVGAALDASGNTVIDPQTKSIFPLALANDGALLTLTGQDLRVEVMSFALPMKDFRIATRLGPTADAVASAAITGSTLCAPVPMYGPFLETLGLCNPQTDLITVFAGANLTRYGDGTASAPAGVGQVAFASSGGALVATVTGSSLKLADHLAAILAVDSATGRPVSLGYSLDTTRSADANGMLAKVSLPTAGHTLPPKARVYLMIDTYPAARGELTLP